MIFIFFFNFQPPCKNNKTVGTFRFPTFQVLFYIEENTDTAYRYICWYPSGLTGQECDITSWNVTGLSSKIITHTNKYKCKQIQTKQNTNVYLLIDWSRVWHCIMKSDRTPQCNHLVQSRWLRSINSSPLAAAVVIKYTNSNQALHLICGNRSNVEKGFNQLETFFFQHFPFSCLVSDFIIPRNLLYWHVLECIGMCWKVTYIRPTKPIIPRIEQSSTRCLYERGDGGSKY